MRCIVQRVRKASVSVGDELVSSIGRGICVLVGINKDDTSSDMEWMANKLLNLRIFHNEDEKRWESSAKDKGLDILCVSQFTLYATLKGNKPDFHHSMRAENSRIFFDQFLLRLRQLHGQDRVKEGRFGAYMCVSIENDGPVTITLDSPAKNPTGSKSSTSKMETKEEEKVDKEPKMGGDEH